MIYPYKVGSASAKALATELGVKQISMSNSKFKHGPDKMVINWGASEIPNPEVNKCHVLNKPDVVKKVVNKKTFFQMMENTEVNIPDFATSKEQAIEKWQVGLVVMRTKLTAHSGEGIKIIDALQLPKNLASFSVCPLFVKYIPKKAEYRVHVVLGEVVDIRKKSVKKEFLDNGGQPNYQVQSYQNGFIFQKDGFEAPEQVLQQALLAVKESGLDFGAVDVIWNDYHKTAYVLEINTAPGLEGSTITNYAKGFKKFYHKGKMNLTGLLTLEEYLNTKTTT